MNFLEILKKFFVDFLLFFQLTNFILKGLKSSLQVFDVLQVLLVLVPKL